MKNEGLTNWPDESGYYKMVQMEVEGNPCIRFGPGSFYHWQIMENLARELGMEFPKVKIRGELLPATQSGWYKVLGMGHCGIDHGRKCASFSGESVDYGMGPDLGHLERMKGFFPGWKFTLKD
jgi:hypothetical protein